MQENNMIAGMGGLTSHSDLADGQEKADMRDPAKILG